MSQTTAPVPERGWPRAKLALTLASPAVLVTVIVVIAALVFLASLEQGASEGPQAGLARIGDAVALLIVTDESGAATASAAREFIIDWGLVAPLIALIPALMASWVVAGRVRATIDHASSEVRLADEERQKRLQEVVHELRTPLAVMGTNLELATTGAGDVRDAAGYVDAARRAVERMARTVNDLEGHGMLAVERTDRPSSLGSLAELAVAEHLGPSRARGLHLLLAGSAPTLVSTDPAVVRTVVGNFLSNAVRLAPRGSGIVVDWGDHHDWAWLSVSDEGPGLAPGNHARVFERGWRGSHERNVDGANREGGLGLTISRQLAEAQGGWVTVESEEGRGSTFTVWLPLGPGAAAGQVVAADGVHPAVQPWRRHLQPA